MLSGATEGLRALGILIGPFIGGPLYEAGGWTLPFVVTGVIFGGAVFSLNIISWMVPEINAQETKSNINATDLLYRWAS